MKSGAQYGREVRELRAAGFEFPASRGYTLANPSQWSSGQKGAVTRAFNRLESSERFDEQIEFSADAQGVPDDIAEEFFEDAAGDEFEEWDEIDFFDFDEGEEFIDEEGDRYEEAP